jgi:hypothetical protein
MTDKTTISRGFNKHFFEFIDDILQIFPDNKELKHAKTTFETFKRANPTAIIKAWNMFVYAPYIQHIDAGNIEFFFDKDYSQDLVSLANSREIMNTIDALREPISNMSSENKQHSMKYIQNLCKLSAIYIEM